MQILGINPLNLRCHEWISFRLVGKPETIQRRGFLQHLIDGLLICEFLDHNWYAVPGLTSMAVGQQISSRRHIRHIQLNVEPHVTVVDSRISLSGL